MEILNKDVDTTEIHNKTQNVWFVTSFHCKVNMMANMMAKKFTLQFLNMNSSFRHTVKTRYCLIDKAMSCKIIAASLPF